MRKATKKAPTRSEEDILAPDRELQLSSGEKVAVREFSWGQTRKLVQWLGDRLSTILAAATGGFDSLSASFNLEVLEYIAVEATGKDAQWLASLPNQDALRVISAALERNLTPEMLAMGKDLAARLGAVLASAPPTTS